MIISKPNRDKSTAPKSGWHWCRSCDGAEVVDGGKCPNCSHRDLCKRRKK